MTHNDPETKSVLSRRRFFTRTAATIVTTASVAPLLAFNGGQVFAAEGPDTDSHHIFNDDHNGLVLGHDLSTL
jgi:hypothetical protein